MSAYFRSPVRRNTRQRSGYKVAGVTTGGECKILCSESIDVRSGSLELNFEKNVRLTDSFELKQGMIAFGGYIRSSQNLSMEIAMSFTNLDGVTSTAQSHTAIESYKWKKFGLHHFIKFTKDSEIHGTLSANLKLKSSEIIGQTNFFGVNIDAVDYYLNKKILWVYFNQKTALYLPEIYYFNLDESFIVKPKEYNSLHFSKGPYVVLKSCNRCSRYLLIDLEDESYYLSFSNHCIGARAPCTHKPSFCIFRVMENQCAVPPNVLAKINNPSQKQLAPNKIEELKAHYGFQLECRVCKKYYVNGPLNPMRNSTQHREDSLRRRAFEDLARALLGSTSIYITFRLKHDLEFDVYIWEKFNHKCFNCETNLPSPKVMDLDHTRPVVYLWPLDETATCLCPTCNSKKGQRFPVDFYTIEKLKQLSLLTSLDMGILSSKDVNLNAVSVLRKRVKWFFDTFLDNPDYQKIRGNKRTSDLIYKALQNNVIKNSGMKFDLVDEYVKITNTIPTTITLK